MFVNSQTCFFICSNFVRKSYRLFLRNKSSVGRKGSADKKACNPKQTTRMVFGVIGLVSHSAPHLSRRTIKRCEWGIRTPPHMVQRHNLLITASLLTFLGLELNWCIPNNTNIAFLTNLFGAYKLSLRKWAHQSFVLIAPAELSTINLQSTIYNLQQQRNKQKVGRTRIPDPSGNPTSLPTLHSSLLLFKREATPTTTVSIVFLLGEWYVN